MPKKERPLGLKTKIEKRLMTLYWKSSSTRAVNIRSRLKSRKREDLLSLFQMSRESARRRLRNLCLGIMKSLDLSENDNKR